MDRLVELHVVLGATGGTGRAIVDELRRLQLPVRAVMRQEHPMPDGVEVVRADVADPLDVTRAVEGATVVYHAANPPYTDWTSLFPPMTEAIAGGTGATGAKLVFADNLYMYGPITGPLSESSPQSPSSTRGELRRAMADDLLDRHRRGALRVAIGRSSDYYGPHGLSSALGEQLFGAVVWEKKPRWLGDPDVPHTEHYLGDIGRALVVLGTRDEADGEVWHLPAAEPMTGRAFVELVTSVAGSEPRFTRGTRGMMRVAGLFSPMIRSLTDVMYQWEQPFTIDATRFQEAFGPFETIPHEEAVVRTVTWFRRDHVGAA